MKCRFKFYLMYKALFVLFIISLFCFKSNSQNYSFNFNSNGQRVCLAESYFDNNAGFIKIKLTDHLSNLNKTTDIYRRLPGGDGMDWTLVAADLPAGTAEWTDLNTVPGNKYEYQIKRKDSWTYNSILYDAIGYTMGCARTDNSDYQGQMILLVASNVSSGLAVKYERLKTELTGEGWKVNEIIVNKAVGWDSGSDVSSIKSQIFQVYQNAPVDDKPKLLFILGHVPMPRSGSTNVTAPDGHNENKGARGSDSYYADIDGVYTDAATYNPGGLQTSLAINLPNDYKWDQDFLPSNVEMGFGRVDFEGITDYTDGELVLMERYLDKLSNYRNVAPGWDMGFKTAFNFGYNNSNDASYRNLLNLSTSNQVYENISSLPHPQWVSQNGPFMVYMQNEVAPAINEWNTHGMNAAIYTSDQSYWGFNDVPQSNSVYSRIRSLPASNTKCIAALWTTAAANLFYQACTGGPIGLVLKEVINHNSVNQKLERPQQEWDTDEWWNRTHFALNGDPSIRLYQVPPARDPQISFATGLAVLEWSAPLTGSGYTYNVYTSAEQFGIYSKMNILPVTDLNFGLTNYQPGRWYMVRSVQTVTSGCGSFYQPGLGVFAHSDIVLSSEELSILLKSENQNSGNVLNWIIEKNNTTNHFIIEHSDDGNLYSEIGNVKFRNNEYQYNYRHVDFSKDINYYRIRMFDVSGQYELSNIVKINNGLTEPTRVFPVPSSGIIYITSSVNFDEINLTDALGKRVFSRQYSNSSSTEIDLGMMAKGFYFISVKNANQSVISRIIIN